MAFENGRRPANRTSGAARPPALAVSIDRLSARFEGQSVLEDISLTIRSGEYFVLLGPSGAGKTTLLRALAGHCRASSGSISLCGQLVDGRPPAERPTSMMFQDYALFDHLSNWENILFPLRVQRTLSTHTVAYATMLAEKAGLARAELDRKPGTLSGGERQRVALLRALVWRPQILLLDEPLAAVDPTLRAELRLLLRDLTAFADVTTVHVTHSLEEAFELAARVGVLLDGRLIQVDTPHDLCLRPATVLVASFLGYVCAPLAPDTCGRASFVAVPATKLTCLPREEGTPSIRGILHASVPSVDGSGDRLIVEYEDALKRRRVARIRDDARGQWYPGAPVSLSCDWSKALLFDRAGVAIGQ